MQPNSSHLIGSLDGVKAKISGFQMFQILFLSRMFSLLSYTSLSEQETPSGLIFAAIAASFLLDIVVLLPILLLQKKNKGQNIIDSAFSVSKIAGYAVALLFFVLAVCIAANTVAKFEFFLTSSVYVKASHILISVMFVLVSMYAVYMGIEALSRFSLFVFMAFAITLLFILCANIQNFDFHNLTGFSLAQNKDVFIKTVLNLAFKNTEYLLILLCASEVHGKIRNNIISWLAITILIFEAVSFTMYCVLGKTVHTQLFPLYTLAGTAEISIFQRLDALHIAIWIFIAFIKTSIFIFYSARAFRYLVPQKIYRFSNPVSGLAVLILSVILSSNILLLETFTNTIFNIYIFIGVAFILPLILLILKYWKGRKKANEKS